MTLQQLHQVITIAESRSMNEASRKLFVSQPNLSAVVRELEEEAGITILSGPTGESCLHQRERNLSDMPSRSWSSIIYWNPVIFRLHPKRNFPCLCSIIPLRSRHLWKWSRRWEWKNMNLPCMRHRRIR